MSLHPVIIVDTASIIWTISRFKKSNFWMGSGLLPISHKFARRLLAQRTVWSIFVVVLAPVFDRLPRVSEGEKPVLI